MVEKIVGAVEKKNQYVISIEKRPEILLEIEKNYRLCRHFYQSLFVNIADVFIQYIHSFEPTKIEELDDDIKENGWRVESIVDIQNSFELLCIFQLFYYLNGCLLLTDGLSPVPVGETTLSADKISLKRLYELFKDTKFHGLVSIQFLSAVYLSFGGSIENSKNTISEHYQNLTFETLSGARQIQFGWILDLVLHITYKLQHSFLLSTEKKDPDTKKYDDSVKEKYDFDEKPSVDDKFEEQIVTDILNNIPYVHIKPEETYVEPTVHDTQTIDDEIKQENEGFLQTAAEFNKTDMAATAQKKQLLQATYF